MIRFSLCTLWVTLAWTALDQPTVRCASPNIVLIYTDDQGYGDASCLNPQARFATPNLDRLARAGLTFTDAHSSDTVCTPSRYGLLTGRYAWRTSLKRSVFGSEHPCLIPDDRMTLASLLKDQSYATAIVGKWHLGMQFPGQRCDRDWSQPIRDMPLDKGFDYFYGVPASLNFGILAWFEGRRAKVPPTQYTNKKPSRYDPLDFRIMPPYQHQLSRFGTTNELGVVRGELEVAPDFVDAKCLSRFTDKAIDWIKSKAGAARSGQPFFLYLPYTSPHLPVVPLKRFRGQSGAGGYGDFMMETDWHVGRILDLLDQEQLTDNTLVIFTSDNGPETTWKKRMEEFGHHSNGKFRDGKRSIYDGGHRVPMFARWPDVIPARSEYRHPVCQTDWLATIAELVATPLPDDAGEDSSSLMKVLRHPERLAAHPPIIHHSNRGRFAIRAGRWKLIMESKRIGHRELYDLESDSGETNNQIDEHPEIAERLSKQITEIIRQGRSTDGKPQPNDTPWWDDLVWMEPF